MRHGQIPHRGAAPGRRRAAAGHCGDVVGPGFGSRTGTALRAEYSKENLSAKGAYKIAGDDKADAVIFATGSEVAIAVEALPLLKAKGISGKVISVPSLELFEAQPEDYKRALIGSPKARVAVEAGIGLSWQKLLGEKGHFVGMHGFGASGPAEKLYEHFGITANGVVEAVTAQL